MDENIKIENEEIIENDSNDIQVIDCVSDEDTQPTLAESLVGLAVVAVPLAATYVAGVLTGDKVKNFFADQKVKAAENRKKRKEKLEALKNARKKPQIVEVVDSEESEN